MVDLADIHDARTGALLALRAIRLLVTEYRRAIAAEDCYAALKRMSRTELAQDGSAATTSRVTSSTSSTVPTPDDRLAAGLDRGSEKSAYCDADHKPLRSNPRQSY